MAVELLVGEAFGLLANAVKDVISKAVMFKSSLQRLQSTLTSITPLMEEIERYNRKLDRPKEEANKLIEQMKEGESIVRKCLKIHRLNFIAKSQYTRKIEELDESILRFFQVDLQVQMARDVKETLVGMNSLLQQSNSIAINIGEGSCAVPKPPDGVVGLDVPLEELKMQLFKDEVSVLLLTAPALCGKSTLVKKLGHDKAIRGKFGGNIFFVLVSRTPNLNDIVKRLFDHTGRNAPLFQNDEHAINQLEQLLNQLGPNPILLIFDDVWSGSESLLEKFEFSIPNYKILVASRIAFPGFRHTYNLNPLNDEDAMKLFCHSANLQTENSSIPNDLVKKIVRGCGGLPMALKLTGKSLCGQPVEVWRNREKKWSNNHSILDSNKNLLLHLESSLDFLDEDIKNCFMDLGSFPEDQRIPASALIDMWVELYELYEDGVIANLNELTNWNLASLVGTRKVSSEADRYYNEDFVRQHDLLRELAIRQSSHEPIEKREKLIVDIIGNKFLKWWTGKEQQIFSARLLSISTDEMFSSNWCNMQLPEVEVLVLNFQTKNYTLPKFVEKMGKLKVLIGTNNGFFPTEVSNFELLGSIPNLKRIRLEKVSIDSLCKNPVPLKSLKKISLFMCSIGQAFRNCTIQISNALPNLVEINIDYCNDLLELPTELCDIVHLKKLSITNCHKLSALPEKIGKLVNLEVLRLKSCTDLSELPESIKSLQKLSFLDISDCLSLIKLPNHIGELCNLKELHMNGCSSLSYELPPSTLDLDQLEVVICDVEGAGFWDPIKDFLSNLKIKIIENDINLNWLANKVA